jgi:creatinine amidohydrolase
MAENRIKYLTWLEFDRRRKDTSLVILPSGAIEVYGPHMPLGSDIIVAEKISQLIADRIPAIVGPSVEIGDSKALSAFPGTLVAKPENLKAIYRDICMSFVEWGFKRILFMNSHLGNIPPLNQLGEELEYDLGIRCGAVPWWQFIPSVSKDILETKNPHAHASEAGTSVLLFLAPEYVDMSQAKSVPPSYEDKFQDIFKYLPFDAFTPNGTIGDATAGSTKKGKLIVERAVDRIIEFIKEVLLV